MKLLLIGMSLFVAESELNHPKSWVVNGVSVYRIYDSDTGAVCYTIPDDTSHRASISCVMTHLKVAL